MAVLLIVLAPFGLSALIFLWLCWKAPPAPPGFED